jgi:hypothetical protein
MPGSERLLNELPADAPACPCDQNIHGGLVLTRVDRARRARIMILAHRVGFAQQPLRPIAEAGTPDEFAAFIKREIPPIGMIVRDAGFHPE